MATILFLTYKSTLFYKITIFNHLRDQLMENKRVSGQTVQVQMLQFFNLTNPIVIRSFRQQQYPYFIGVKMMHSLLYFRFMGVFADAFR